MKKIGLFGGTFDPVHNGHLIISEYLWDLLELEEIWFIPAKKHPLKNNMGITPTAHRLEMLKLAVADNPHLKISEVETKRAGVSYTIDTLIELENRMGGNPVRFYFFIGMDNVNDLHRWKSPDRILEKSQVVAFGRPGFEPRKEAEKYLARIKFVHVPLLEISSTLIRKRISEGRSVRYLIPESVERYIHDKQLYTESLK